MATFTDRLRILVDWDDKSAKGSIKGFSASIKEAEGLSGKFKAGWGSAMDSVKANAAALAATVGVALVAAAAKSVTAFRDVALAAEDMGNATGLSTEQASRWIAVADDFNVSADTLQASIGRIAKDLDSDKWEKYGIATRDAAGNARDANAILLDVLDALGRTSNETERARMGAELLGRGWQGVAPILGKTREEYEQMLSTVEDGQVITDEEAAKARKFDRAMDDLGDALTDVQYAFGELIADGVTPFISGATKAIGKLAELKDKMDDVSVAGFSLTDSLGGVTKKLWDNAIHGKNPFEQSVERLVNVIPAVYEQIEAMDEAADLAARGGSQALADTLQHQADAARNAADTLYDLETAELSLMESTADLAAQEADTAAVLADSASTDAEKQQALIDLRQAQIGTAEQAIAVAEAYAEEQGATADSTASYGLQIQELERLQDTFPGLRDEIQKYIDKLNAIPGVKTTRVQVTGPLYGGGSLGIGGGGATSLDYDWGTGDGKPYASGTTNATPGVHPLAEEGPELVFRGGESVLTADRTANLLGGSGGLTIQSLNVYASSYEGGQAAARALIDTITAAYKDGIRADWMTQR